MSITRRHLFGLFAAPAIVRASNLMPVVLLPLALWEKQERIWALWYGVSDDERLKQRIWRKYSQHPDHFLDRWHIDFLSGELADDETPTARHEAALSEARRLRLLNPKLLTNSPNLTPESGHPGPYVDGTYHPSVKKRSPWHPERVIWVV